MKQIFNKLILTIIISLIFSEIYEGHLLYSLGGGGGGQGGGNNNHYTRLIDNNQNIITIKQVTQNLDTVIDNLDDFYATMLLEDWGFAKKNRCPSKITSSRFVITADRVFCLRMI